jgi:hypothetical protein
MGSGRRLLLFAAGASVVAAAQRGPDVSERAVVAAAAAYVAEYQRQLTSILADERYTQEIVSQVPETPGTPRWRVLTSEVFFVFTPASREWMAIRDVKEVDGRRITERPDLQQALQTLSARDVSSTFKAHNAQFNLGRTYRNFNEPTLSLLVLDREHRDRFSFDRRHVERTADAVLVTLAFEEKEPPTLIRDMKRGRVFSNGTVLVEAGTGRIRHAVLKAKSGNIRLELMTEYAPDSRLAMWVPVRFQEHYWSGDGREREEIRCDATYTNLRRFETSVRVK